MSRLEKVDVPGNAPPSDTVNANVFQDAIYKSVTKSFQIESIISNVNLVYEDIGLGMSGMEDDDVFIDKEKELPVLMNNIPVKNGSQNGGSKSGLGSSTDNKCLSEFEAELSEEGVDLRRGNRTERPRRKSDVIDCLGDDFTNMKRSSDPRGIAIANPRSRISSDLGYSGSYASSPAAASSFPPAALYTLGGNHKKFNDLTDSKPVNFGQHRQDYAPLEARMPVERDAEEYNMSHPRRGRAVIINNDTFDNNFATPRTGSDVDVRNLERCFSELGFQVTVHDNYTYQEIKQMIYEISQEDHNDADSLIVTVLTHGMDNGLLYARDSLYPVESLWSPFTADRCLSLAGKPKIFFVQACRGDKLDPGVNLVSRKGSTSETDAGAAAYKIPSYADFLIAYSSMHGFYSWRNPEDGTWFIQSLVQELKENGSKLNFLQLLTRVNRRVALYFSSQNDEMPWLHEQKQVPTFHSTLIRDLIFRPKIFDI